MLLSGDELNEIGSAQPDYNDDSRMFGGGLMNPDHPTDQTLFSLPPHFLILSLAHPSPDPLPNTSSSF